MSHCKTLSITATVFIIVVCMLAGSKTADASNGPLRCMVQETGDRLVRIGGGLRARRYYLKFIIINTADRKFTLYASGMAARSWHTLYDDNLKAYYWDNGYWEMFKNDRHIPSGATYEIKVHADDPEEYNRVTGRNPTETVTEDPSPAFIEWTANYRDQYGQDQTLECSWEK